MKSKYYASLVVALTVSVGCQHPSIWMVPTDSEMVVSINGQLPNRTSKQEPYLRYWDKLPTGRYPIQVNRGAKRYTGEIEFTGSDVAFYVNEHTMKLMSGDESFKVVKELVVEK